MAFNLEIPKELSHLKLDERGYPIPYFVTPTDGKPEFRFLDPERIKMIVQRKVCHICGKRLQPDNFYFIAGPIGLQNKVGSDAPMHLGCAEFSLRACPHMYLQKAEYRINDDLGRIAKLFNPNNITTKPDTLYLVKADKFRIKPEGGRFYIHYRPVSTVKYVYLEGKLVKADQ